MRSADRALEALVRGEDLGPIVFVAAHPDDETIWAGGCLADRSELALVHLTDGAPVDPWFAREAGCATRAEHATLRDAELERALDVLGMGGARRLALAARDQEASDELERLVHALTAELRDVRPAMVITHAYEGGHPDHDAAAFVARAALRRLGGASRAPVLVEVAGYHASGDDLEIGFLPREGAGRDRAHTYALGSEARARKERALRCFASQRAVIERLGVRDERFRIAAPEDFTIAPHPGRLLYERHGWRIDGAGFRHRAALAARALDVPPRLP